jgi:4-amino-4-deoxy-L-arabinose transferase-like glycosyltransferase
VRQTPSPWRSGSAARSLESRRLPSLHLALILIAIVGAAAVTRLLWLDLMEFKSDEAGASRLALHALGYAEPGVGRFFPTAGLVSSVGVLNPPLFIYLLALPLAIVRSPVAAATFIALTNVVAVWLCYVAGRRYFSTFVGLTSAGLFALSPWAIVYSRKIWAQDLIPICAALFLIALHEFLVKRRPRAVVWLILIVGIAIEFHFSAGVLALVTVAAFVMGRDVLRLRYVAIGLGAVALLYAPFLWHVLVEGHVYGAGGPHLSAARRLWISLRDTLTVGYSDRLSHVLGSQSAAALPVSVAFGIISAAGLVAAWRVAGTRALAQTRALLLAWFILPLVLLTLFPVKPYDHYFIVLYPLPFLGLAVALEAVTLRYRLFGRLAVAGCLLALALFDAQFFRTVHAQGGAPGDYHVAYKYKLDAVAFFVRQNPTRHFELRKDWDTDTLRFLEWNLRGANAKPLLPAIRRYVVTTDFHRKLRSPAPGQKQFGPIHVTMVPLQNKAR